VKRFTTGANDVFVDGARDESPQVAEWQVALKQATQAAQIMDQLPGGITLAVDEVLRPELPGSPSSDA
jgi:hypothetical protein